MVPENLNTLNAKLIKALENGLLRLKGVPSIQSYCMGLGLKIHCSPSLQQKEQVSLQKRNTMFGI